MHEQLPLLLDRASRYRDLARTVREEPVKQVLLTLAADYVALAQLLLEHPTGLGSGDLPDALMAGRA